MKNKLRGISFILSVMLLIMLCTGCSGGNKPSTGTADGSRNLKLATIATTSHSMYGRIKEFTRKVEEGTNGAITFTIYPADQLGDYMLVYEELMKGNIEASCNSIPSIHDNRADAFYIYYLLESYEDIPSLYGKDSYLYSLMDEITSSHGVKFVNFDFQGMGGLAFTKMPKNYNIPGAEKDTVVRVPPTDVGRLYMESLGYTGVTVNYGDLFSALQTGVVEGWVGGNPTLNYLSFRDAIKYYVQTNDLAEMCNIMFNQEVWDSFTPEQQEVIQRAADEQFEQSQIDAANDDKKYCDMLEEYGIEVIYLTDEEIASHADFVRENVWPSAVKTLTQEVLDNLYAETDRIKAEKQ